MVVVERTLELLFGYLNRLLVSGALGILGRPALAVTLYALAVLGVFQSTGRMSSASRYIPPQEEGASPVRENPSALVLARVESARLRAVERVYSPGELIYSPGDGAEQFYFLRSGTVRAYRLYGEYKEATTGVLKDGGLFGRPDLEESGTQDDFAEAMTECRVVGVRKSVLMWLVRHDPEVSLALFSALSERMKLAEEFAGVLLPREVSSRLAMLLVNLVENFGVEEEGGVMIDLRLPHRTLAGMIASTREAVSKAMGDYQREGLIEPRGKGSIVVLDRWSLRDRAEN